MAAMIRRGKITALSTAAAGIVALAAVGFAARSHFAEMYWSWLLKHGDRANRERAGQALAEMDSPVALPHLLHRLSRFFGESEPGEPALEGNFSENAMPVGRIHRKYRKETTAAFLRALSDPGAPVRSATCLVVTGIRSEVDAEALAESLIAMVKGDPDYRVRANACQALGRIASKNPDVRQTLEAVVQGRYPPPAMPPVATGRRSPRMPRFAPPEIVRKAAANALEMIPETKGEAQR